MAAKRSREVAAGSGGVPGSVGGAARGRPWIEGMTAGATCDGGPTREGRWRLGASDFRVAPGTGCPTACGTCSVPTDGSSKGGGNVWGIATVGVAAAGAGTGC